MSKSSQLFFFLVLLCFSVSAQTAVQLIQSGTVKSRAKDYEGAIVDYDKAILLDSNQAIAFYNRALAKGKLNNYQGSVDDYTSALKIKDDPDAYYARATMFIELSRYKDAIADLDKCFDAKKDKAQFYFLRGDCKFLVHDYQNAIEDISKAIELKPDYGRAFLVRGLIYVNLKNKVAACPDFQKAKELDTKGVDDIINKFCL